MKKKIILSLMVLIVAFSILAVSAEDLATDDENIYQAGESSGGADDAWIDQTVDESRINVDGYVQAVYNDRGDAFLVGLSNSTSSTWGDMDSSYICNQTINNALDTAKTFLGAKNIKVVSINKSTVMTEYDHRVYSNVEEPSGDNLIGYYGPELSNRVTHIAEGAYARILNVTLQVLAECSFDETEEPATEPATEPVVEPVMQNTTDSPVANNTNKNTTNNTTDNTTNNTSTGEKNITNKAPIKAKEVVAKTGIPFAALFIAVALAGVSLRRKN